MGAYSSIPIQGRDAPSFIGENAMWTDQLQEQILRLESWRDISGLQAFLGTQGLMVDKEMEYAVAIVDDGRMVATGSFSGRVLKCIAVDDEYKSQGLSARVVTHLVNEEYRRGRTHLFIFTKPENKRIFSGFGFHAIAEVPPDIVLLENRRDGVQKYLDNALRESGEAVPSAAMVVNCNPFTLGHRYLIEYAAARYKRLHVFVVREDRSIFPSEVRYRLVQEGIKHLSNVVLHWGKDYIISDATFPSYFMKKDEDVAETYAKLDLTLFTRYIAPYLRIEKRFVGEEPFCGVTRTYNRIMKEMLPSCGIEVEEVPRLAAGGVAISASRVRELIRKGDMNAVQELVPDTTYTFLMSPGAGEIIRRIRGETP